MENVTWHEADVYCKKAGKRLPTEWEWEKAAKAETTTKYYWGDAPDNAYLWWSENSGDKTHPVGEKKPNGYGLYDMAGNVWEWTASDYAGGGKYKVLRGGSWINFPYVSDTTKRFGAGIGFSNVDGGFRCAK